MARPSGASDPVRVAAVCAAAWAIPGAGHLWLGRRGKGAVFLVALLLLFVIGLGLDGELYALDPTRPFVALQALADGAIGIPYFLARALGAGGGEAAAATYEYGNTFLVVAGLLNVLVMLDAFDIAHGRK